jgi:[acyl-carrier-protein] S-malonyltransferase
MAFSAALPLVHHRGALMHEACERTRGTMAALFGLSLVEVRSLVSELNLPNDLWVANVNSKEQIVISGTLEGVERGIQRAKERGAKRAIPLKVHGAFHSGLMQSAKEKLREKILATPLQESEVGVVMNVPGELVGSISEIRSFLIAQVTEPVLWEKSISTMQGGDLFLEIGPGKTLAGLNKQMGIQAPTLSINKIEDLDILATTLG